jgi:hypothetical protein
VLLLHPRFPFTGGRCAITSRIPSANFKSLPVENDIPARLESWQNIVGNRLETNCEARNKRVFYRCFLSTIFKNSLRKRYTQNDYDPDLSMYHYHQGIVSESGWKDNGIALILPGYLLD